MCEYKLHSGAASVQRIIIDNIAEPNRIEFSLCEPCVKSLIDNAFLLPIDMGMYTCLKPFRTTMEIVQNTADLNINKIFPNLWLGSVYAAVDTNMLRELGITHVVMVLPRSLNVRKALEDANLKVLQIQVNDDPDEPLVTQYHQTVNNFIEDASRGGGCVLVHCMAGVSRSASLVVAHVMTVKGWSLERALTHVKAARPCIEPNEGFLRQLAELDARGHARAAEKGIVTGHNLIALEHS